MFMTAKANSIFKGKAFRPLIIKGIITFLIYFNFSIFMITGMCLNFNSMMLLFFILIK
jgi:hypothetical protein